MVVLWAQGAVLHRHLGVQPDLRCESQRVSKPTFGQRLRVERAHGHERNGGQDAERRNGKQHP